PQRRGVRRLKEKRAIEVHCTHIAIIVLWSRSKFKPVCTGAEQFQARKLSGVFPSSQSAAKPSAPFICRGSRHVSMKAVSHHEAASAASSSRPHSPSASSVASSQLDAIYRGNLPADSDDPDAAELSSSLGDTLERENRQEDQRRYLQQLSDIGRQIQDELQPNALVDVGCGGGTSTGNSDADDGKDNAADVGRCAAAATTGAPSRFSRIRKIKVIDSRSRTAVSSGESTPRRRSRHRSRRASSSPSRSRSSSAAPVDRHGSGARAAGGGGGVGVGGAGGEAQKAAPPTSAGAPETHSRNAMATATARLVSVSADEADDDDDDDAVFEAVDGLVGDDRWHQNHHQHQPKRGQQYQHRYQDSNHQPRRQKPGQREHQHKQHQHYQNQEQRDSTAANSQSSSLPTSIRTSDLYPKGSETLTDAYRYRPSTDRYAAQVSLQYQRQEPPPQQPPQLTSPAPPVPPRRQRRSAGFPSACSGAHPEEGAIHATSSSAASRRHHRHHHRHHHRRQFISSITICTITTTTSSLSGRESRTSRTSSGRRASIAQYRAETEVNNSRQRSPNHHSVDSDRIVCRPFNSRSSSRRIVSGQWRCQPQPLQRCNGNGRIGGSDTDDSDDPINERHRAALKLPSNAVKVLPTGAASLRRNKQESLLSPRGATAGDPVSEIEGLCRQMQLQDDDLLDGAERHDTLARVQTRLAKLSSGGDEDDVFAASSGSHRQQQQLSPARPQAGQGQQRAAYFVQHRGAFPDKELDDQARRHRLDSQRRYGGPAESLHHSQHQIGWSVNAAPTSSESRTALQAVPSSRSASSSPAQQQSTKFILCNLETEEEEEDAEVSDDSSAEDDNERSSSLWLWVSPRSARPAEDEAATMSSQHSGPGEVLSRSADNTACLLSDASALSDNSCCDCDSDNSFGTEEESVAVTTERTEEVVVKSSPMPLRRVASAGDVGGCIDNARSLLQNEASGRGFGRQWRSGSALTLTFQRRCKVIDDGLRVGPPLPPQSQKCDKEKQQPPVQQQLPDVQQDKQDIEQQKQSCQRQEDARDA
uniref:SH2 domain-containing protein n=1 Tax=Macrostomum lignano TaxID=282301 RepID=A0A1I8GCX2_9PLAT